MGVGIIKNTPKRGIFVCIVYSLPISALVSR